MDEDARKTPWSPIEQDVRLRNGESLLRQKNFQISSKELSDLNDAI
ncbi:hypothetical protein LEP1GSC192_0569 [Leptospira sp. B5-022]|nr:hypothetical protein LEP1GSC192_0569 [Leptospira sp. B5-022]